MLAWLAPLFGITAVIYASVGFAGGSTYTALLVLAGIGLPMLPIISLACNIVVSAGGLAHYGRAGAVPWRRCLPLLVASVPLAWLGGRLPIDREVFVLLLAAALALAGLLLLFSPDVRGVRPGWLRHNAGWIAIAVAGPVGLLSGVVGIGGGIFLAPLLHLMRWDGERRIAGAATLFILVNSLAGVAGQLSKLDHASLESLALTWWPLLLAVAMGGQLGSYVGSRLLPAPLIRRVTGVVVLAAAIRLLTA